MLVVARQVGSAKASLGLTRVMMGWPSLADRFPPSSALLPASISEVSVLDFVVGTASM